MKPIQAKTLIMAVTSRRPADARGGRNASRFTNARAARPAAASKPAMPRAKSGGQSCIAILIIGQPKPQPTAVPITRRRPTTTDPKACGILHPWQPRRSSGNRRAPAMPGAGPA